MTLVEKKKDEDNKDPSPAQNEMGQRIAHQWRAPQVDLSPKRRGQKNALSPLGWKSGRERQNYRQPKTLPCRGKKNPKKRAKQRPSEAEKRKCAKETTKSANRRQSDQQKRIATELWMGLVGKKQVENRARKLRSGSIDKNDKTKKNKEKGLKSGNLGI